MKTDEFLKPVVSVDWLSSRLDTMNLIVLDATMGPKNDCRIPGARPFDFDKRICDKSSHLPHMMPTPERFEKEARNLGINSSDFIVVYDSKGVYSSPLDV